MTREECTKLIAFITVSFPSYLKGLSSREKQGAVNHWMEFIGDLDAELGYMAVKEYLHTTETLYQSDNVPLLVQQTARKIRNAIKAEFPTYRFAYKELNAYVSRKRSQEGRLGIAARQSLPPEQKNGRFTKMLEDMNADRNT